MTHQAFVTFLMLNDSFLPGALMLAHALRKQEVSADIVCMITPEITPSARQALKLLFDFVVEVPTLYVPHKRRQERQDRPYWYTRFNALRLGPDGDLGFQYRKLVLLDADVLPLKNFERLFAVDTPAAIPNENKNLFFDFSREEQRQQLERWSWHETYDPICPHGAPIPKAITDRVLEDPENMGVNGSLLVIEPSLTEYHAILADLERPDVRELVSDRFNWPDMQYITMRWSGRWHTVDIKYSGFNGYPNLRVLNGTHFAGVKPWYFKRDEKAMKRYSRYEDYRYWFAEYKGMLQRYPRLLETKKLAVLLKDIEKLQVPG
jgi:glycogenin glucosyltransferase